MASFWPLLCRIVTGFEGTLGVALNATAIGILWNRKVQTAWSTYRIGITVAAMHGVLMSVLGGATSLSGIFHDDNYFIIYYGANCFLPKAVNDVITFLTCALVLSLWQLPPAGCILQFLSLCRPQYSNRKRLCVAYATIAALIGSSAPFFTTLHAPPSQIELFEQLTRRIHNLTADDVFLVYGAKMYASPENAESIYGLAVFAVLPSYFIANVIFW